jgi:hypothetical protein
VKELANAATGSHLLLHDVEQSNLVLGKRLLLHSSSARSTQACNLYQCRTLCFAKMGAHSAGGSSLSWPKEGEGHATAYYEGSSLMQWY